jgi:hypothetical protein
MPDKKGDIGRVVVEHRGGRPMSRARQQAEVEASSIFAKPSERSTLGLGGVRTPAPAATPSPAEGIGSQAPRASSGSTEGRERDVGFESRVEAVVDKLANGMTALTGSMEVLVQQMNQMAKLQSSLINVTTEAKDQSVEQAKLAKQNNEAIARLAPMVTNNADVILGNVREAMSDMRVLAQSVANAKLEAPTGNQPAGAAVAPEQIESPKPARGQAEPGSIEPEGKVAKKARPGKSKTAWSDLSDKEKLEALGLKRGRGRPAKDALTDVEIAEVLASATPEATRDAIRARRSEAVAAAAAVADTPATVELPKDEEAQVVSETAEASPEGEEPGAVQASVTKRGRRSKADLEIAAARADLLASLGLKRGRGRPAKDALSEQELDEVVASSRPKATLKAILERRAKAQSESTESVAQQAEAAATADTVAGESIADKPKRGRSKKVAESADVVAKPSERAEQPAAVAAEPAADKPKRGRPKKVVEASAEVVQPSVPVEQPAAVAAGPAADKPKRGRPKKVVEAADVVAPAPASVEQPAAVAAEPVADKPKRGRPKKAVQAADVIAQPSVPVEQPAAAAAELVADKPKRGRPKKVVEAAPSQPPASAAQAAVASEPVADKPKRGRPKKVVEAADVVVQPPAPAVAVAEPVADKPKRGRPKKNADSAIPAASKAPKASEAVGAAPPDEPAKKKRGRPRKDATEAAGTTVAKVAKAKAPKALSRVDWSKVPHSNDVMILTIEGVTNFQIDRSVWNEAGFGANDKVMIETNGEEFRLSKSDAGTKPSTMSGSFVVVSFSGRDIKSLWKIQHVVEDGQLLLKGVKAL